MGTYQSFTSVVTGLVQRGEHILYYSLEEFWPAIEHTGAYARLMKLNGLSNNMI